MGNAFILLDMVQMYFSLDWKRFIKSHTQTLEKKMFLVQLANILHPAEFLEDSVEIVFHNAVNIARTSFLYFSMNIS